MQRDVDKLQIGFKAGRDSNENETIEKLEWNLFDNYLTSFNPATKIAYMLPQVMHVKLLVYDIFGREVATLVNALQDAGYREVSFDASNLPSGVYFCRFQTGMFTEVKKMILAK